MAAMLNSVILNLAILESAIIVFPLKHTHTCQDWLSPFHKKTSLTLPSPPFTQNNFTHSFWFNLMMVAILNSAILDSDTAILDSDTWLSSLRFTQNTLPPLWLWLNIIQSDSTSFILTQFDDGSFLEFCHLKLGHLGISHLSFSSQTHSHLPWLVPTICTKKTSLTLPSPTFAQENFTHSFWLNLMMVGILKFAILNSAILDSASALWN